MLFTQMTANFFRLVFKKSAKCFQIILPICQSVSFACCRRGFRPFGINAAHFAGSLFPKNTANLSKCHLHVTDGVSGHLASMLLISLDYRAGFLITLLPNRPFASNSFFRPKTIFKVAIMKTMRATICG